MTGLTQSQIDYLLTLEKQFADPEPIELLGPGESRTRDLESLDGTEMFILDVERSAIHLTKHKIQGRTRQVYSLLRLCVGKTRRHRNPDGDWIVGSHLHIRSEKWGDRHALPIPDGFSNADGLDQALCDLLTHFNVVGRYTIEPSLFLVGEGS